MVWLQRMLAEQLHALFADSPNVVLAVSYGREKIPRHANW